MRFNLYPIYWVANPQLDPEPFDHDLLPFDIGEGVRLEAVAFRPGAFEIHRKQLGDEVIKVLERVRYALVHRYNAEMVIVDNEPVGEAEHSSASEQLVRSMVACLRLIRPMRQHALMMKGIIREEDGSFDVLGFDVPNLWLHEVPEVQKLWHLRTRDCEALRRYVPEFLRAMGGEFWKFRMAVQFHEQGFFQSHPEQFKARLLLWASAIESIYTSNNSENKGTKVATERIKWFLGENTPIYSQGDLTQWEEDPNITVSQVGSAIYNVRNFIAHGDRLPDVYFSNPPRRGINGDVPFLDVCFEAMSFIIRTSLLKILRDGLLDHFKGAAESDAYFGANGLNGLQIQARQRAARGTAP